MKVFVIGATGRVATQLIKDLVAAGHDVIAGARSPENITISNEISDHVTPTHLDVHNSVEAIAATLQDAQAVYFVAGSRGKDLLQTDAFGAVKTMQAAEQIGAQRYIMLSSIYSLEPNRWNEPHIKPLLNYITAKFFADNYLVTNSKLDYTVLQPTSLTEDAGTGKIALGDAGASTNPIADVAQTLASILENPNTIGTVIRMGSGSTPINEALARV